MIHLCLVQSAMVIQKVLLPRCKEYGHGNMKALVDFPSMVGCCPKEILALDLLVVQCILERLEFLENSLRFVCLVGDLVVD